MNKYIVDVLPGPATKLGMEILDRTYVYVYAGSAERAIERVGKALGASVAGAGVDSVGYRFLSNVSEHDVPAVLDFIDRHTRRPEL